jgi:hypothetical protein
MQQIKDPENKRLIGKKYYNFIIIYYLLFIIYYLLFYFILLLFYFILLFYYFFFNSNIPVYVLSLAIGG